MKTIPQRELRNHSGRVLREAEAGETFTITVDGRPVASLGPHRRRQWVPRSELAEILRTPTDEAALDDILEYGKDEPLADPWEGRGGA